MDTIAGRFMARSLHSRGISMSDGIRRITCSVPGPVQAVVLRADRSAAIWRALGFPNLVRARAALTYKVRLRRLEEWKRKELRRTPFAILDEPPPELSPVKRPR